MAITHKKQIKVDFTNLALGIASTTYAAGTNHKLILYTGTPPANAEAALSSNVAAATITLISWGTPNSTTGVSTLAGSTADPGATGGTVTFFRLYRTAAVDGTDQIIQGTVGTSASDLIINNTTISASANVSLTGSNTYTPAP